MNSKNGWYFDFHIYKGCYRNFKVKYKDNKIVERYLTEESSEVMKLNDMIINYSTNITDNVYRNGFLLRCYQKIEESKDNIQNAELFFNNNILTIYNVVMN